MKIALYGKTFGSDYDGLMREVLRLLKEASVDIWVYEPFWKDIKHCFDETSDLRFFSSSEEIRDDVDMLFSFGGDGTILDSVPLIRDSGIPVLGINTGNLGFLSSVSPLESEVAVRNILSGNYEIEKRSLIQIKDADNIWGLGSYDTSVTVKKK